jgi:hypothetical protein
LSAIPEPVGPTVWRIVCEWADNHEGSHVAFTLASHDGALSWWVRLDWQLHEVVQIDLCDGG